MQVEEHAADVVEPVDPDAAVPAPPASGSSKPGWFAGEAPILAVIAVGGVVGALARYGAGRWLPTAAGSFPWTTWGINVAGCALIGVLLVLVSEVFTTHRLVRPLLGTGVLGGFTTFSTYAVDAQKLVGDGRASVALVYLGATAVAALAAVTVAARATRRVAAAVRS